MANEPAASSHFIHTIIDEHNRSSRFGGRVQTRFPPEPNGYLHIGHAKSICLNFGTAQKYGGKCNLRFDDTNPIKEEQEYVDSIMEDVKWLGFQWDNLFYASDYFEQLYQLAIKLINKGKAFVCDMTPEQVAEHRGGLDPKTGKPSPYRNRTIEENLDLFQKMKAGAFPDGSRTLRAKIDVNSPNLNMRDPVLYRILRCNLQACSRMILYSTIGRRRSRNIVSKWTRIPPSHELFLARQLDTDTHCLTIANS